MAYASSRRVPFRMEELRGQRPPYQRTLREINGLLQTNGNKEAAPFLTHGLG